MPDSALLIASVEDEKGNPDSMSIMGIYFGGTGQYAGICRGDSPRVAIQEAGKCIGDVRSATKAGEYEGIHEWFFKERRIRGLRMNKLVQMKICGSFDLADPILTNYQRRCR